MNRLFYGIRLGVLAAGCALLFVPLGFAQDADVQPCRDAFSEAALAQCLVDLGLEEVSVSAQASQILVSFENRRYRYDVRALTEIARQVRPSLAPAHELVLLPRRLGWPLMALRFDDRSAADSLGRASSPVHIDLDGPWRLPDTPLRNPARWKLDLVVRPQVAAQFGNFEDPVQSQLNLVPEAQLRLWRGFHLLAQLILPLQNELDDDESDIRPGLLTAFQVWRFPKGIWASLTAGYFTQKRYGLDAEVLKYILDGRLALGGRLGYTGYAWFNEGEWLYNDLETVTWTAYATLAALPTYGLAVQVGYSRFLSGDTGMEVEVRRAFGEVEVAFRGVHTTTGTDAGFSLAIPLPLRKYGRPQRVRVRPAESLTWTYWYRGLPPDVGQRYRTGHRLYDLWDDLEPALLQSRITRSRR